MSPPSRTQVLIVGAGPVGLALAGLLARRGADVVVVEARPEIDPTPRASHVHGAVLELLEDAGIDRLVPLGRPTRGSRIVHGGRVLSEVLLEDLSVRYPFSLALPQPELERALADRANRPILRGWGLASLSDDGRAELRGPDRAAEIRADWVIGCDGARSEVRALLGVHLRGWSSDRALALADVPAPPTLELAELHVGRAGMALRVPLRDGERWVVDLPRGATPADVPRLFRERVAGAPELAPSWVSPFRVHARWTPVWRRGRVLLAGDAAHLHSPVGGHGMNTGLFDALDLAARLGPVTQGAAPEAALDGYGRMRGPSARRSVLMAWAATQGLLARGPLAWARDPALRLGDLLPFARRQIALWGTGWDVAPRIGR